MRSLASIIALLGTLALATAGAAQQAPALPYKPHAVKSADGVTLAVQEWGNPTGREILFIHGFSQASLSWSRQVQGELAKEFRMVTFDLRGHGGSDKPLVPEAYRGTRRWAEDLDAIMKQVGLRRAPVGGGSYRGRGMNAYLGHYGERAIACRDYAVSASTAKH